MYSIVLCGRTYQLEEIPGLDRIGFEMDPTRNHFVPDWHNPAKRSIINYNPGEIFDMYDYDEPWAPIESTK